MIFKKTKIVCTLGPASNSYQVIKKLAQAGMDVARLNFSHGTQDEKKELIEIIRKISKELNKSIAIMADLQGPKIRLGEIEGRRQISKGEKIILSLNPTSAELPMQFDLSPYVLKNQRIFLNDGLVELKVVSVRGKTIETLAQNSGVVSSHKGVNIPDTKLKDSVFTQKDFEDAQFALKEGVDYLSLSFIQTPKDLQPAKKLIQKLSPQTKIIVKIEKKEAVENLEEIIKQTDAVMVARGDLAIEVNAPEVPLIQQNIIRISRQLHKPVIVATQMLESMTVNPRPTRAEISDVANAVLDQVDAVMLSAESAAGKYPVAAVETMASVIYSLEQHPDYKRYIRINWEDIAPQELSFSALTSSAASIGYRLGVNLIAVGTATGRTSRILSSFRPASNIIAATHDQTTFNQLSLLWGVCPVIIEPSKTAEDFWKSILEWIKKEGMAKKGEKIIIVGGSTVGISGATDTIKLATI